MSTKKTILVAPLNWGLGHSARCIPVINMLLEANYQPIIASDGAALELLKLEFPDIEYLELPSYNITYPKNGKDLKFKLLKNSPKVLRAIHGEKKMVKNLIRNRQIDGIISDNRLGVHSKKVPSVIITHQLRVLSGNTTWLSTKLHQYFIKKFDECWVPDVKNGFRLSGKMSRIKNPLIPTKYLGVLSRFNRLDCKVIYSLLVLLSGPEPQRSILENKLLRQLKSYKGKVLFIRGVVEPQQSIVKKSHITIVNFLESKALEEALNRSTMVLSRSGYTTILDLAKLNKKAFFIPTPGQFEQEYLAKRLEKKRITPCSTQEKFSVEMLEKVNDYSGFQGYASTNNIASLFDLFERKGKLTADTKLTFHV